MNAGTWPYFDEPRLRLLVALPIGGAGACHSARGTTSFGPGHCKCGFLAIRVLTPDAAARVKRRQNGSVENVVKRVSDADFVRESSASSIPERRPTRGFLKSKNVPLVASRFSFANRQFPRSFTLLQSIQ